MRRLSRGSAPQEEERAPSEDATDVSPACSLGSAASRGSRTGHSRRNSSIDNSTPSRPAGSGGSPPKPGTNKKMLKIGANVRFRGDVMECDTVLLCGRLQGCVESRRMIVREGATFMGDAKVEEADVHGILEGSLETTSKLSIRSTGTVYGTVVYRRMTMEDGGELEGTCECSARRLPRDTPSPLERLREHEQHLQQEQELRRQRQRDQAQEDLQRIAEQEKRKLDEQELQKSSWQEQCAESPEKLQQQSSPMTSGENAVRRKPVTAGVASQDRVPVAVAVLKADASIGVGVISVSEPAPEGERRIKTPQEQARLPWAKAEQTASTPSEALAPNIHATGAAAEEGPPWWFSGNPKPTNHTGASRKSAKAAMPASGEAVAGASAGAPSVTRGTFSPIPLTSPVQISDVSPAKACQSPGVSPAKVQEAEIGRGSGVQAAPEASVLFSESDTPRSLASNPFVAQAGTSSFRRSRTPPAHETPPSSKTPPSVLEGSSSVAAMVETWPPISPRPAKTPVSWTKETERTPTEQNTTNDATSTASRSLTPPPPTMEALVSEAFVSEDSSPPPPPGGESTATPLGAGNGGVAIGGDGGGGGEGVADTGNAGGSPGGEASPENEIPSLIKACEAGGCTLEACWGDPRFRPRYCARHKRPGNKLMDPVEQEEGDEAAEPDNITPPSEQESPVRGARGTPPSMRAAELSTSGESEPSEEVSVPRVVASTGSAKPPTAGEPNTAVEEMQYDLPRLKENGWKPEGLGSNGGGSSDGGVDNGRYQNQNERDNDISMDDDDDDEDTEIVEEESEDDEDEDEGWDDGGIGAAGVVVVQAINGGGIGSLARAAVDEAGGAGRSESAFASLSSAPRAPLTQQRSQQFEAKQKSKPIRRRDSDVQASHVYEKEGDVLARVATFERLAKKKAPTPKAKMPPKAQPPKPSSGNNIADFYGRGAESESDEEETSFSNDHKNLLLSQAAEAGTHTEDGQLRPQASEQRDQQRLAHLVRVGKLGSALRGRGVSAVGKRR